MFYLRKFSANCFKNQLCPSIRLSRPGNSVRKGRGRNASLPHHHPFSQLICRYLRKRRRNRYSPTQFFLHDYYLFHDDDSWMEVLNTRITEVWVVLYSFFKFFLLFHNASAFPQLIFFIVPFQNSASALQKKKKKVPLDGLFTITHHQSSLQFFSSRYMYVNCTMT